MHLSEKKSDRINIYILSIRVFFFFIIKIAPNKLFNKAQINRLNVSSKYEIKKKKKTLHNKRFYSHCVHVCVCVYSVFMCVYNFSK